MILVERRDELATLAGLLAGCSRGKGRVALISGGVGHGKTGLLHTFVDSAVESGAVVLSATGSRAEQGVAMGVLAQLLLGSDLGDVAPEPSTVCAAVLEMARQRPVVIAVDDVDLADSASAQALLYLVRRMKFAAVLMVLSEQATPGVTPFQAELTRQPHVRRIRLHPLSRNGIADLLGEEGARAAEVESLTGGNPLLVHAVIEDPAVAFGQAVVACLHRWESDVRRVAQAIALLGPDATAERVGRLAGVASAAQLMDMMEADGLLDAGRFRHPVAVNAVMDSLSSDDRARLHARAAELLHREGSDAAQVAGHLLAAEFVLPGDSGWAVDVLCDAAEWAETHERIATAIRCLELASRICADSEWVRITKALARVEWNVNPAAAALRLESVPPDALDRGDTVLVFRCQLWQNQLAAAAETLRGSRGADPRLIAQLRLAFLWICGPRREFLELTELPGTVPESGDSWTVASTIMMAALTGGPADIVEGAEQVLHGCRLASSTVEAVVTALFCLSHAGRPDKAADWCDGLLGEARDRQAGTWLAILSAVRADIALRQGNLPVVVEHAEAALAGLPSRSWGVVVGAPLAVLLAALTEQGKHAEAAHLLHRDVPEAVYQTVFGLWYLQARGRHQAATAQPAAAIADFRTCGRLARDMGLDLPALLPWRSDLAVVHIGQNRPEPARDLVTRQLRLAGASPRGRGISLRVLAKLQHQVSLLTEAVGLLRESGDQLELTYALADLSQAYHRLGQRGRARMAAHRAVRAAKSCGAEDLCRRLLPVGAGPVPPAEQDSGHRLEGAPASLSNAERRVAMLATLGHVNREIAAQLHVTVSTVEQHLTRVYRKLNVSSRTDLPALLTVHPESESGDGPAATRAASADGSRLPGCASG